MSQMIVNQPEKNLTQSAVASQLSLMQTLIKNLAAWVIHHPHVEERFRSLCLQKNLRDFLKLGAIAYGCIHVLKQAEIRLAQFSGYALFVNIAEPLGIRAYFFQENATPWFVADLIRLGDVCLDIGANMGHYTFLMASKVGSQGKVIAFEPQPNYHKMIQDSIHINHWHNSVSVDARALWYQSGDTLKFYLSDNPNNSGTSSLVNHGLFLNEDLTIQVNTITLSDYSHEQGYNHYRVVKIDVERVEHQVLKGMTDLLETQSLDYIIVETSAHSEAFNLLLEYHYSCYLINSEHQIFIHSNNVFSEQFGDYLFISPQSLDEFKQNFLI